MYSNMFDSTKFREEMSQYLADHPKDMQSWCNTMMNNPQAMQSMHDMMGHGMMGSMMGGMSNMSGMGGMNSKLNQGSMGGGMGNMSNMMHP
jgi:hypothetical protein